MTQPLIIRAAYLHLYFDLFREIGIPVDRALARSRLPGMIEDDPDAYVSLPLALTWLAHTGRDLAPMELGFLAAGRLTLDSFDATLTAALGDAVTGRTCIERYFRLMALEDSTLQPQVRPEGDDLRLIMSMPRLNRHPHACLADWVNIQALVMIIRSIVGPGWSPAEITLASPLPPPVAAREAFGDARVLVNQLSASVLVAAETLARPRHEILRTRTRAHQAVLDDVGAEKWSFRTALRAMIQPYIAEGRPDLAFTAELVGMSPRTLQRRLKESGQSYSAILEEARFGLAVRNLGDDRTRIVDVAQASGYENPQHFARAFRRHTGLSPTEYRRLGAS